MPTLGAGLWGQLDLAGELYEWNLDWYSASGLPPPARGGSDPVFRGDANYGFRCARTP